MRIAKSPRILIALAALLAASLCACANPPADTATARNFPVVEPFAIDKAGSKVSVEFELPDARAGSGLRPVFIGFRGVHKKRYFSEQELQASIKVTDYMQQAPIPVRLRVWRLTDQGHEEQVALQEVHVDLKPPHRATYHPVQGDVLTRHPGTSMDNEEMVAAGHYDDNAIYHLCEFARIVPPTPGRYRLEAASLETHPILHGMRYELMVSHYYEKGIY